MSNYWDKNGKEIREGYIVRIEWNNEIAEEVVESQGASYVIELHGQTVSLDNISSTALEIIDKGIAS